MGCSDCGGTVPEPVDVPRVFRCPLDGAHVEIRVKGDLTPENLPLVQQYLVFVYDVLSGAIPESHEGRFD